MNYLNNLQSAMNREARTENGAVALRSSMNPLVDFFALAAATRKNPELGLDLFLKAYAFDKVKAIRILFYLRDIRGGQGERTLFRHALAYLSEHEPETALAISAYVPEYGRWDDLWVLDPKFYSVMVEEQLADDKNSKNPSLLAKWLPSENTSSKKTKELARKVREAIGMTPRQYRKTLANLRKQIAIIETPISEKEYKRIDYSKIPSQAGLKYRKAFYRNDETRYTEFLGKVTKGEAKINTSTLYPHQVYEAMRSRNSDESLEVMWTNLPDYTSGKKALVVADVSGSMSGQPMAVSVALALYFAERNEGPFKDTFITFSGNPTLQKVVGKTLRDKMNFIERSDWQMNTNINRVFELLVNTAVQTNASPDEMPDTIYIISDMQFDAAGGLHTNFEQIDAMYAKTDYKRPQLVFWNVRAAHKQVPVEYNQEGVAMVSGFSPSTFRLVVENKTPVDLMEDVINSDRYAQIVL